MQNNPSLTKAAYFHLPDSDDAGQSDLLVKWGGEDVCSPDYVIERSGYPYYVIELVVQGQGAFASREQRVRLAAGSVYFFAPHSPHRYQCVAGQPMHKLFIVYSGQRAGHLSRQTLGSEAGAFRVSNVAEVTELFDAVLREGRNPSKYGAELCEARLRVLLYRLAGLRLSGCGENSGSYQTYQLALRYLDDHFARIASVGELAAGVSVHESYLCRLFKRYGQGTPLAALTRLRMNQVANLLLTTHAPIKEIASALGFTDQYTLSKGFRKSYGISPNQYRQLNQPTTKSA